jgi:hypothetical protein
LWITEMGWATGGPPFPFVVGEDVQADYLQETFEALLGCAARWNLQRVYWFGLRDQRPPAGGSDYWGYHNGLLSFSGRWKPGMRSFLQFLRRHLPRGHRTTCRGAARAVR